MVLLLVIPSRGFTASKSMTANLPYTAKWISRNVISISTLMSSVTLSVPALRMSQYFTSLDEEDLIAVLVFTDGNDFQIPIQLTKNTDKSICEGQSWTRCFLNFLVKFRQSRHPQLGMGVDIECKIRGAQWQGLQCVCELASPPSTRSVFLSSEQSLNGCYVLSRLALRGIFFHSTDCIHKALFSEDKVRMHC